MPRKTQLASHYSSDELKQKYLQSKDPIESRRWHVIWKVSQGWTLKNSVIAVGISYNYGIKVVKKYNELGEEGIKNQKKGSQKSGRKKQGLLKDEHLKKLAIALESKPSDGGIWTGLKVARWIEKETGVEKVWNQRGWDYLKKLEYSWQNPRPKHRKGNKDEQEEFQQNLPLTIINPQQQQVEIYRPNQDKKIVSIPVKLSGEDILPNFVLDLRFI